MMPIADQDRRSYVNLSQLKSRSLPYPSVYG